MVDVGAHALPLVLAAAVVIIIVTYGMAWIYVRRKARERVGDECALMVVLGSGGHTAEMLKLVQSFPDAELAETTKEGRRLRGTGTAAKVPPSEITYPRCYVVAQTDSLSASKALRLEGEDVKDRVRVETIPRSREVGQSYLTSCLTTINAICFAIPVVAKNQPKLLLVNGPGTCLPLCIVARVLQVLRLARTRIVYVESIARVTSLSLTGKLLHAFRIADRLLVQWPELAERHRNTAYVGRLV